MKKNSRHCERSKAIQLNRGLLRQPTAVGFLAMTIVRMLAAVRILPDAPGVYLFKGARGTVLYVGKASSLKRRVASYWRKAEWQSRPQVRELIKLIKKIQCIQTPTVIEALILEANLIKKYEPKYNIIQKDDKSFLYLAITRDPFPRPLLVRGHELAKVGERRYRAVFGPYTSPASLRAALKLVRRIFPWSTCLPGQRRPCFDYHIRACPGVCIGAVSHRDYARTIRGLILFFQGKKSAIVRGLRRDMARLARDEHFEEAEVIRRKLYALEHIQDIAVLTRDESPLFGKPKPEASAINVFGRVEGYDLSNISGTSATGSMVVFFDGEPEKASYRKFRIKTVSGANDYAMLAEVLGRRFRRTDWPRPDLAIIDGGWGQVKVARDVMGRFHADIPIVGIAKGFDRKQDRLIYSSSNSELARIAEQYKDLLLRVRDEAHRFAVKYHRKLRGRLPIVIARSG